MAIGSTSNMEWLSGPGGSGTAEYTAGHGIDIDNEEHIISVDTDEIQEKLTAGENITIVNNVISANPQRQSDWAQTDSSAVDYIRNKPDLSDYATQSDLADVQGDITNIEGDILNINADLSGKADKVTGATAGNLAALDATGNLTDSGQAAANLVHDASYVHTDNNFTTELRTKLINIEGGAEVNAIEKVKMNSVELPIDPTDRSVNIPVAAPTGLNETAGVMTPADKAKLNGIESGAEVNVQSNWAETNQASDSYIANKPDLSVYATKVSNAVENDIAVFDSTGGIKDTGVSSVNLVHDASYVHTDNNFTDLLKTKLEGIQGGAEQNVQSDWTESDSSSDAYIQHKPDLSVYATQTDLAGKQDVLTAGSNITIQNNVISATAAPQQQADWNQTDTTAVDYIKNKPTITAQVQSNWTQSNSSAVDYIKNKPANLVQDASYVHTDNNFTTAEKTKLSGIAAGAEVNVQSDWSQTDSTADDYIKNKPTVLSTSKELVAGNNITLTQNMSEVIIAATGGTNTYPTQQVSSTGHIFISQDAVWSTDLTESGEIAAIYHGQSGSWSFNEIGPSGAWFPVGPSTNTLSVYDTNSGITANDFNYASEIVLRAGYLYHIDFDMGGAIKPLTSNDYAMLELVGIGTTSNQILKQAGFLSYPADIGLTYDDVGSRRIRFKVYNIKNGTSCFPQLDVVVRKL